MVDSVAGSVMSSQFQAATQKSIVALKIDNQLMQETIRAIDDTTRVIQADSQGGRGSLVNIKA